MREGAEKNSGISPEVKNFIEKFIDSVELLSILIFLSENSEKAYSIADIAQELRSTDQSVMKRVSDLYSRGVLIKIPSSPELHSFRAISPAVKKLFAKLLQEYKLRPYKFIELIYSRPDEKLRAFSDAFRIKKEDQNDS